MTADVSNEAVRDAARGELDQILSLKSQMAPTDSEVRRIEADINSLVRDQERMRQNISSLNQVSGQQQQVQSYAKQLADQESKLAGWRDRTAELQRKRAAFEAKLTSTTEK